MSHGGMVFRYPGKQPVKKRSDDAGKKINGTCFFAHIHETQEQGHHTDQSQGDLDAVSGRIKNTIHDRLEYFGITKKNKADERRSEGQQKKNDPKQVEGHIRNYGLNISK